MKIIAVALPLLLLACSPAAEEKNKYADHSEALQPASLSRTGTEEKPAAGVTDIPGSTAALPEINANAPQQEQVDSSGQGGGGGKIITQKKGKDLTEKKEEEQQPVKHIIQTADIKIQVSNLDSTADAIELITKKYGAYISAANQQTDNKVSEATMTLRVRQENFSPLIRELMKQSKFTNYKNIHTDDVSAEYVDIESRLKTKKEVEARYMELLRNKAHTIEEVLRAENEIRVIHEEIEAKTGRLNFIKDQVAYSTINLNFYVQTHFEKEPEQVQYSWAGEMGDAFGSGWNFCKKLIISLTYLWPLYIVLFALYLILKKYVFKKLNKTA